MVVDIENLAHGAVLTPLQAHLVQDELRRSVQLTDDDHVVIGVSHIGALNSWIGWEGPRPRILARSGQDGADLTLLEVLSDEHIAERFDQVVLASGDGIFTDAISTLGSAGTQVTVVAWMGHCSKRLRMAAHQTTLLAPQAQIAGVA